MTTHTWVPFNPFNHDHFTEDEREWIKRLTSDLMDFEIEPEGSIVYTIGDFKGYSLRCLVTVDDDGTMADWEVQVDAEEAGDG